MQLPRFAKLLISCATTRFVHVPTFQNLKSYLDRPVKATKFHCTVVVYLSALVLGIFRSRFFAVRLALHWLQATALSQNLRNKRRWSQKAAVDILHNAGIPKSALQLLPGDGALIGAKLVADERVNGVAFTGSTETAKHIQRSLAQRSGPIVPLIAETGGQNAMLVDSTALPEQVVRDVIASAFQSAGQRCSALRVLFLQNEIADNVLTMLRGAMDELETGDPTHLNVDVGPIIDGEAKQNLQRHIDSMSSLGYKIYRSPNSTSTNGNYFVPALMEIKNIGETRTRGIWPRSTCYPL